MNFVPFTEEELTKNWFHWKLIKLTFALNSSNEVSQPESMDLHNKKKKKKTRKSYNNK